MSKRAATRPSCQELVDRLAEASEDTRWGYMVDYFAPLLTTDVDEWISELAEVFVAAKIHLRLRRSVIGRLAWIVREQHLPIPHPTQTPFERGSVATLAFFWYVGERHRYDFRFSELSLAVPSWRKQFPTDALLIAFEAFGALGSNRSDGYQLWRAALAADDCDDRVKYVCLHAMWFANQLPDQGKYLLELADGMLSTGDRHHVLIYRKAFALRRLGQFSDALSTIDLAISHLDPTDLSFSQLHQDYVRERELIVASQNITAMANEHLRELKSQLANDMNKYSDEAQKAISESLFKLIEILGLFVTLAGFLIGTGSLLSSANSLDEISLRLSLIVVGCVTFFILLRFVVRGFSRKR